MSSTPKQIIHRCSIVSDQQLASPSYPSSHCGRVDPCISVTTRWHQRFHSMDWRPRCPPQRIKSHGELLIFGCARWDLRVQGPIDRSILGLKKTTNHGESVWRSRHNRYMLLNVLIAVCISLAINIIVILLAARKKHPTTSRHVWHRDVVSRSVVLTASSNFPFSRTLSTPTFFSPPSSAAMKTTTIPQQIGTKMAAFVLHQLHTYHIHQITSSKMCKCHQVPSSTIQLISW